jgi:hypothetical protein
MRFTQRIMIAAAAAVAVVALAGPAMARGYSGNAIDMLDPAAIGFGGAWPVTITNSQRSNSTGCLTLTGKTSGSASLAVGSQKFPFGSFQVRHGILVATITEPLYGQNGALMFIAHAGRGTIGQGIFENVEGGSNFDSGDLAFGMKNGC